MGRKKVFPAGDAVNPLQRMFGTFLRLERTRLGHSSKEVAEKLGVSDTYLRLAESGRAALNQSLVFKIIEVFADSEAPTHDSRTISFNRLALFMVGMHWAGAEMADLKGKSAGQRATAALAASVSDFQVFTERTKQYFALDGDEQRAFLETVAAREVGLFLRSEAYGGTTFDEWDRKMWSLRELLDLPTLNIDILLDLKQSLTGRSFVHTVEVASKWESQRSSQFRSEHGLYTRAEIIIDEENLNSFHFEHLAEKRFSEVQMMFMQPAGDDASLTKEFLRLLDAGRKAARIEPTTKVERDKIHIRCLSEEQITKHEAALAELRTRDASDPHEAYWSFETNSGLHIGFVGLLGENAEATRNLNLRDSITKAKLFRHIWDDINAPRTNKR